MALLALRNGCYWLVKRPFLLDEVGALKTWMTMPAAGLWQMSRHEKRHTVRHALYDDSVMSDCVGLQQCKRIEINH